MAVVALPAGDRRLPASESFGKLALAETGAPSCHQDVRHLAYQNGIARLADREFRTCLFATKCAILCAIELRTWARLRPRRH